MLDLNRTVITPQTKDSEFFFVDKRFFVKVTPNGIKNEYCEFSDELDSAARVYADNHTPNEPKDKAERKFMHSSRVAFWCDLYALYIWKVLKNNNNVVEQFKSPAI